MPLLINRHAVRLLKATIRSSYKKGIRPHHFKRYLQTTMHSPDATVVGGIVAAAVGGDTVTAAAVATTTSSLKTPVLPSPTAAATATE